MRESTDINYKTLKYNPGVVYASLLIKEEGNEKQLYF